MKRYYIKNIITILLILIVLCVYMPKVFAEDLTTIGDITQQGESFLETGIAQNSPINEEALKSGSGLIYNVLLVIGIAVVVIWGLVIGIQFIIGSIDEKAEVKKKILTYLIGCIIIFGAFGIWRLAVNSLSALNHITEEQAIANVAQKNANNGGSNNSGTSNSGSVNNSGSGNSNSGSENNSGSGNSNSGSESNSEGTNNNESSSTSKKLPKIKGDLSKLDEYSSAKVVAKSGNIKLREVISNFNKDQKYFQNFAITDEYVYLSKIKGGQRIVRIRRSDNGYETKKIKYSGHLQSFDVMSNYSNGEDVIVSGYFEKASSSSERGIAYFGYNNTVPNNSLAFIAKENAIKSLKKFSYQDYPSKLKYYNAIGKVNNNSYLKSTQVATDEDNNQIVVYSYKNRTFYVYVLSDFFNGKLNLINSFSGGPGYGQGVEIYGDYVYYYQDCYNRQGMSIIKYNIKKGKKVAEAKFYLNNGGCECEGISIYKGKVFVNRRHVGHDKLYYVDGI